MRILGADARLHLKRIFREINQIGIGGSDRHRPNRCKAGIAQEFARQMGGGVQSRFGSASPDSQNIVGLLGRGQQGEKQLFELIVLHCVEVPRNRDNVDRGTRCGQLRSAS